MSYYFLFLSSIMEEYKHSQTYHTWGKMDKMVSVKELMADVYNMLAIWASLLYFGNASSFPCVLSRLSHVRLSVTPWTVAYQAPLSMGFSRQEYWNGLPFLLQGIFPTQGLNPHLLCLLHWHAGSLPLAPPGKLKPFMVKCYSFQTDSSVPGPMLLCLPFQGLKDEMLFCFASWAYKMSPFPDI